jgi:hypothetical protein
MRWFIVGLICGAFGCCSEPAVGPKIDTLKAILRAANETQTGEIKATREELVENTAALNEIRFRIEQLNSTVSEKIPTPKAEAPETPEPAPSVETSPGVSPATALQPSSPEGVVTQVAQTDVTIYVSTTSPCAPCERLKRDHAAGKFAGFDVRFATDWAPRSYPAIRYPSKASATGWAVLYGYDGQPTIDRLKELTSGKTVLLAQPIQAPAAMSHSDMVSLHNRLHGGGQWTWPGDLASHLQQSHGVSTGGFGYGSASYPPANSHSSQRYDFRSVPRGNGYRVRSRYSARSSFCPTCPGS